MKRRRLTVCSYRVTVALGPLTFKSMNIAPTANINGAHLARSLPSNITPADEDLMLNSA